MIEWIVVRKCWPPEQVIQTSAARTVEVKATQVKLLQLWLSGFIVGLKFTFELIKAIK